MVLKLLFLSTKNYIKYKVSTITLDNFLKKNKIKSVDVIKVDIDGSEYEFLQGARKTLKKNKVKIILLEIVGKKNSYNKKEKKIVNFFNKNKYTLIKKKKFWQASFFSNVEAADYLFISNAYLKSKSLLPLFSRSTKIANIKAIHNSS